ncbi:MAG: CRISPR-associated ring nuclease [Thermoplasmatales archaeon]|nr:CRISPR-associated ring nuclease [Candidatus Methanoperedenaceae archaeon]MCG2826309.1 CRISPR-associated ring nuclease [Thermoplasmatales archaeon]
MVTEALDFLTKERGIKIDEVVLLTTIDSNAEESLNLLITHIPEHYKISSIFSEQTTAYDDIDDEKSLMEFMEISCKVLKKYKGSDVYVSIAGGRKTMSALMTLAVQIYGAKELFHVIVKDQNLEKESNINRLRHFPNNEKIKFLHPDKKNITIIRMPFIGLFPWISDIIKALKGGAVERKEIRELLVSNDLIKDNKPTDIGKTLLDILDKVESIPEPCKERKYLKPEAVKHHNNMEIAEMAKKVMDRFNYICEAKPIDWKEGQPKVKIKENDIEFYFQGKKGFNLGLMFLTTAKTQGQLEAVKNDLERYLRIL